MSVAVANILNHERYETRFLLGEGAFGSVFRGWDRQLERDVAIKVPKVGGKFRPDNFLQEAKSAARLRHPGLVAVYDAGVDRTGQLFAVYELVDGRPLSDLAASGKLDVITAVRLVAEAAEAMAYTHGKDFVHRDLKPSNILVDGDGRARVTDFGLALDENQLRDRAGEVSGSPAYMSPEQVRGEANRLDGRTDIWSLGVILYELLTSRRPFYGRNQAEYFDEILNREPKPMRQINNAIPRALDDAVLKCLAKPVRERYAMAGDFAADLRAWLATTSGDSAHSSVVNLSPPPRAASAPTIQSFDPQATTSRSHRIRESDFSGDREKELQKRGLRRLTATLLLALPLAMVFYWAFFGRESRNKPPVPPQGTAPALPAGWEPLLVTKPSVVVWPVSSGNSQIHFREANNELMATCVSFGAFRLAETMTGTFQLSLDIAQTPWTGGTGAFWGLHQVASDAAGTRRFVCEAIELIPRPPGKGAMALGRSVLVIEDSSRVVMRTTVRSVQVDAPRSTDAHLQIEIRDNKLRKVSFAGKVLPELTEAELQDELAMFNLSSIGTLGVFVDESTAVFRSATWNPLTQENDRWLEQPRKN